MRLPWQQQGQTATITEAVITVPAYFNDRQRYATQMAARQAGIIPRELLAEPTAAAISYGFQPDSQEVKTMPPRLLSPGSGTAASGGADRQTHRNLG
jgi:Hsp70 protein